MECQVLDGSPYGATDLVCDHRGLNRDGTPSPLSKDKYDTILGPDSTEDQRRELYGRYLAMMTEKFRTFRWAGVMHFCGLGYSRDEKGYTCDNFIELEKPTFDPYFYKYVRDSFAPVGLMVDLWEPTYKPGESFEIPVSAINDLGDDYKGKISVFLCEGEAVLQARDMDISIPAYGDAKLAAEFVCPEKEGKYEVIAEVTLHGKPVRSYRMISVSK